MKKEWSRTVESNYVKQVYIGREYFLKYDQNMLIKKYGLEYDKEYLYLTYIATKYRIKRTDGAIEYEDQQEWRLCKEYTIVMTIYDLLCYSGENALPPLTGQWQPVAGFAAAGSSPSAEVFAHKYEKVFSGRAEEIRQACLSLGGIQKPRLAGADLTFEIPVVSYFSVLFQYWDADEEFPAKILILWDKASMSYLHFETTYYLQGDLLEAIARQAGLQPVS